jgi:hypothetical protein
MENIEPHINPKKPTNIFISGGAERVGLVEQVMAMHHLHEVEIINIGAIEKVVKPDGDSFSDSLISVIDELKAIRRPELIMALENMCIDPDDFHMPKESYKDITKFYGHYYKGKRKRK